MAAATAAGSDTGRARSIGRGSASTGSGRTSASCCSCSGVRKGFWLGHPANIPVASNGRAQSARS